VWVKMILHRSAFPSAAATLQQGPPVYCLSCNGCRERVFSTDMEHERCLDAFDRSRLRHQKLTGAILLITILLWEFTTARRQRAT
jgi:hypothetical protein